MDKENVCVCVGNVLSQCVCVTGMCSPRQGGVCSRALGKAVWGCGLGIRGVQTLLPHSYFSVSSSV